MDRIVIVISETATVLLIYAVAVYTMAIVFGWRLP